MRISREYGEGENISSESVEALENYKKRRIVVNIGLHRLFLTVTIIVDIVLVFFIAFYKKNLSQLKSRSERYSMKLNRRDNTLQNRRTSIAHKLVNIGLSSFRGGFLFTYSFQNLNELELVKVFISNFYKEKNINEELDEYYPKLVYQGYADSDLYEKFIEKIEYIDKIVIMIDTHEANKIGIFIDDYIENNDKEESICESKNIFIFFFETKQMLNYTGNRISVKSTKDKMLIIGDDDIVINNKFFDNGGIINYPFKSFDTSYVDHDTFSKFKGTIRVKNIEVFKFFK